MPSMGGRLSGNTKCVGKYIGMKTNDKNNEKKSVKNQKINKAIPYKTDTIRHSTKHKTMKTHLQTNECQQVHRLRIKNHQTNEETSIQDNTQ